MCGVAGRRDIDDGIDVDRAAGTRIASAKSREGAEGIAAASAVAADGNH